MRPGRRPSYWHLAVLVALGLVLAGGAHTGHDLGAVQECPACHFVAAEVPDGTPPVPVPRTSVDAPVLAPADAPARLFEGPETGRGPPPSLPC